MGIFNLIGFMPSVLVQNFGQAGCNFVMAPGIMSNQHNITRLYQKVII